MKDDYTIPTLRKENTRLIELTAEIDATQKEIDRQCKKARELILGIRAIIDRP